MPTATTVLPRIGVLNCLTERDEETNLFISHCLNFDLMKKAPVPFSKGPMYPIKAREGAEIIPGRMVSKILKRLDLDLSQQLQFWNIEEHRQYRSAASTQ